MRITVIKENFSVIKDFTLLGYMGENNARVIEVDQPEVEGADTYRLRFEYQDEVVYDLPIENGMVTVTGSLLREVGKVNCQWLATKAVDDSYELVAKSQVFGLCVEPSIDDNATPIPSPEIATDALMKMQETVAHAENCVADAQDAVAQAETIAQGVEEAVSEVKSTIDQVSQNTATLSEIITKSDIEYEVIEGIKLGGAAKSFVSDQSAFTLFIKIPSKKFAWVAATASNTEYEYNGNIKKSAGRICDSNKTPIAFYGSVDENRTYYVFRGDNVNDYEDATYFATSYTLGSQYEIKIGGIDFFERSVLPISLTDLPEDFILHSNNLITETNTGIIYNPQLDRWTYSSTYYTVTNFLSIKNNQKYYHNGKYITLLCFDENYKYVTTVSNYGSGTNLCVGDYVKYAYICTTVANSIPKDFWFCDKNIAEEDNEELLGELGTAQVINPKYIPSNNNSIRNSPLLFNINFKNKLSNEDLYLLSNYNTENHNSTGYILPNFENKLSIGKLCVCDDIAVKAVVKLTSTDCNVLLGSSNVYSSGRASAIQFDFANKVIKIAPTSDGKTIPETVLQTADMSSVIDNNLTYILEVGRKKRELYAKITNYNTGLSVENIVSENDLQNYTYPAGYLYDEPMIALVNGENVILEKIYCQIEQYDIAFMGDSITEGRGVPYTDCWSYKAGEWSKRPYVIMGRAGGQIDCLIRQTDEILPYIKPKYVIVTIGTNGGNTAVNLSSLMYKIRKIGAFPILNNIFTETDHESSIIENNLIDQIGEHGARFDIATSIDGNPNNGQDTSLYLSDKIHPNILGHNACFERFKLDCDFLENRN